MELYLVSKMCNTIISFLIRKLLALLGGIKINSMAFIFPMVLGAMMILFSRKKLTSSILPDSMGDSTMTLSLTEEAQQSLTQ